jgi:Acetyltransferase (GNAT) family
MTRTKITLPAGHDIVRVLPENDELLSKISAIAKHEDIVLQGKVLGAAKSAGIDPAPYLDDKGNLPLVNAYQLFQQLPKAARRAIETEGYLVSGYGPETYKEWAASKGGIFAYCVDGKVAGFITAYAPEDTILASDRGSYFTRQEFGADKWQVKQIATNPANEYREKGIARALFDRLNRYVADETLKSGGTKTEIFLAIVDTPNNKGSKGFHEAIGYARVVGFDTHPDKIIRGIYGLELDATTLAHAPSMSLQQRKQEREIKRLAVYVKTLERKSAGRYNRYTTPPVNRPKKLPLQPSQYIKVQR